MEKNTENILSQKSIQEMVMVANEFCHLIESSENQNIDVFVSILQKMMPLMYLKGSLLPDIHPQNPDALTYFVTEEDWSNIFNKLKNIFQNRDLFLFTSEDCEKNDRVAEFSMSEDLSDIYQDMKDCLKLLQLNTKDSQENAISELHRLFNKHWGVRVCRIQYAVHFYQNKL